MVRIDQGLKVALQGIALMLITAVPAIALTPGDCDRITHVSLAGEEDHVDLGDGRVMWRDWWSQEGTATNIVIMDCEAGRMLDARTAEMNMTQRPAFERTEDAMGVIAQHEAGSRVFATLDRIAADLRAVARDVMVTTETAETCACAAFYPELRGDKDAFGL